MEAISLKGRWHWCDACECAAITCKYCNNTSCNGGGCDRCFDEFTEAIRLINEDKAPPKFALKVHYDSFIIEMVSEKVFKYIDEYGVISDEDLKYNKEKFDFDRKDYTRIVNYIVDISGDLEKYQIADAHFETYCIPYKYKNKNYCLEIMYGQGTSCILMTKNFYDEWESKHK